MLDRLHISLIHPRRIGMFLNDKWIKIILYVLILSVFCALPNIIVASSYKGLDTTAVNNLEVAINNSKDHIPNGSITNYVLNVMDGESGYFYIDSYRISINEENVSGIAIVLKEDGLALTSMGVETYKINYKDLDLENLNFTNLKAGDFNEIKTIVKVIDKIIMKTKPIWLPIQIIASIISNFFNYVILCLVMAVILKIGSMIPFVAILKITFYANTISQIALLISNLYGLTLLYYISGILGIAYAILALKSIIITTVRR